MNIILDFIPISLNKLYRQFRGRTIISKEGREFKELIGYHLKDINADHLMGEFVDVKGLIVEIEFYSSKFYTKDGNIRKRYLDLDNLLKVILDVIFKQIGLDDSLITRLHVSKHRSLYDKTIISIRRNIDD